jgi:hypothetical protein
MIIMLIISVHSKATTEALVRIVQVRLQSEDRVLVGWRANDHTPCQIPGQTAFY